MSMMSSGMVARQRLAFVLQRDHRLWRGIMNALEVLHASTDGKTLRNGLRHFEDIWDRSVPLSTVVRERS
jgi:hypothetical protein